MNTNDIPADLRERLQRLQLISFDVDGVLTDGKLYYADDGRELKAFNVQDGASCKLLAQHGIHIAILTGRNSPMVARRAAELGIEHVYQGLENKLEALQTLCQQLQLRPDSVAHVGDDLQDLVLFDHVGLAISVPNGHPAVIRRAHHVTQVSGGGGVARELAELILRARGAWTYD